MRSFYFLAKTRQRQSGKQSYIENRPERSRGEREVEGRTRGGRDSHGRRTVCGRRRVVAVHERAERIVFHRNRGTGRVG